MMPKQQAKKAKRDIFDHIKIKLWIKGQNWQSEKATYIIEVIFANHTLIKINIQSYVATPKTQQQQITPFKNGD